MKNVCVIGFLACAALAAAAADGGFTVRNVSAAQRWPWAQTVDIEFYLEAPENATASSLGAQFRIDATVSGATKTLTGLDTTAVLGEGYHSVSWDPTADFPDAALKGVSFNVVVTNAPYSLPSRYMTVDLDTGKIAYYGIVFSNQVNSVTYKARYMAFKYIPSTLSAEWQAISGKDSFTLGTGDESAYYQTASDRYREAAAEVRLTKGFWLAVFPATVGQLNRLGAGTDTNNVTAAGGWTYAALRGADTPGGAYCWPQTTAVDPAKPLGVLRAKTGLNFDFPTEAQWEYAARAGTVTPHVCASDAASIRAMASLTISVGTKPANPWGLYDMIGCRHNWTLTLGRSADNTEDSSFCLHAAGDDPVGQTPTYAAPYRVTRGTHSGCGSYDSTMIRVTRSAYRFPQKSASPTEQSNCGARFALTTNHP
jgi:formylglycine-generating enzyme required for sulfatase activity